METTNQPCSFLIVEDRFMLEPLARRLRRRGDLADHVATGRQAWEKIQSTRYDVIIIDGSEDTSVLPGRILSDAIAERFPSVVRIGTSGILTADRDPDFCRHYNTVLTGENLLDISRIYRAAGIDPRTRTP